MYNSSIVLIVPSQKIPWISANKILSGLLGAYVLAYGKRLLLFKMDTAPSLYQTRQLAKKINRIQPEYVCFLGMKPHPLHLLTDLTRQCKRLPAFVFHIYGDFTCNPSLWQKSEKLLNRAYFLCGSLKQKNLVDSFMKEKVSKTCAFSCDKKEYYFSSELQNRARHRLHLSKNDILILYTGRISSQKNIFKLIENFFLSLKKNKFLKLIIVGQYDDSSMHFKMSKVSIKQKIEKLIQSQPPSYRERIIIFPQMDSENLRHLYLAADYYISLSVFHDEDFGMSPIEALFCGTQAILTDWGGYSSFKSKYVNTIDTFISNGKLKIDESQLLELLGTAQRSTVQRRKEISNYYQKRFSTESMSQRIKKILKHQPPPFKGFSALLYKYQLRYISAYRKGKPIFPKGPQKSGVYYQIYSNYIGSIK